MHKAVIDVSGPLPLQRGDRLMLCSDGLWSSVEDADIRGLLAGLLQLARHLDGDDASGFRASEG